MYNASHSHSVAPILLKACRYGLSDTTSLRINSVSLLFLRNLGHFITYFRSYKTLCNLRIFHLWGRIGVVELLSVVKSSSHSWTTMEIRYYGLEFLVMFELAFPAYNKRLCPQLCLLRKMTVSKTIAPPLSIDIQIRNRIATISTLSVHTNLHIWTMYAWNPYVSYHLHITLSFMDNKTD